MLPSFQKTEQIRPTNRSWQDSSKWARAAHNWSKQTLNIKMNEQLFHLDTSNPGLRATIPLSTCMQLLWYSTGLLAIVPRKEIRVCVLPLFPLWIHKYSRKNTDLKKKQQKKKPWIKPPTHAPHTLQVKRRPLSRKLEATWLKPNHYLFKWYMHILFRKKKANNKLH